MELVGFSGRRGSGKTTAAKYLVNCYGFQIVSFAESLKNIAEQMFPGIGKAAKEKPFKTYDWSPRDFYISLGELGRYYDPNLWVNVVLNSLKKNGKYAIDDVRYRNEAELIKGLGGKMVRINRYESQNPYGKNLDIDSEKQLDDYKDFDFVVHDVANTTIKGLATQMDLFMDKK